VVNYDIGTLAKLYQADPVQKRSILVMIGKLINCTFCPFYFYSTLRHSQLEEAKIQYNCLKSLQKKRYFQHFVIADHIGAGLGPLFWHSLFW